MSFLAKSNYPQRRKADKETWDDTVEQLARELCPIEELEAYQYRQQTLARNNRQVKVFPVWRKYRYQARKIASIQSSIPFLKRFPLQVSWVLGEIFLK